MKKYLDKNGLQDYTRKLTQKYKTMFSSPLIATTAAQMTDINKVYVYVGSESGYITGNCYYYDGTNWKSGGVYNAVAVETDTTLTESGKAADAKAVGDALNKIVFTEFSKNLYPGVYTLRGGFINTDTGEINKSSSYTPTDYIDVSKQSGSIVFSCNYTFASSAVRYAFYDKDKNFISGSGGIISSSSVQNDTTLKRYYVIMTVPTNAAFMRFSAVNTWMENSVTPPYERMIEYGNAPTEYEAYFTPREGLKTQLLTENPEFKIISSITEGVTPAQVKNETLTDGQRMVIESNSIMKNQNIVFFAKIGTLGTVYVGHGKSTYGFYIGVTNENLLYIMNGSVGTRIAHGLTITDFVLINLNIDANLNVKITITTAGGSYTKTSQINLSTRGEVFAESEGSSLTNCVLAWNSDDYKKPVWAFGDSYFTLYSATRWPNYIVKQWGYDTMLLNAYPGETAKGGYNDLINALKHGTPKYILWCLGMNNPDTASAINADWLSTIKDLRQICEEKNITLVLATIPETTSSATNNAKKNQYIVESGLPYVDFAKAVLNVDGWESSDGVHPSEIGGKILAAAVMSDFPQILQGFPDDGKQGPKGDKGDKGDTTREELDDTLTKAGYAADAKAVGDKFNSLAAYPYTLDIIDYPYVRGYLATDGTITPVAVSSAQKTTEPIPLSPGNYKVSFSGKHVDKDVPHVRAIAVYNANDECTSYQQTVDLEDFVVTDTDSYVRINTQYTEAYVYEIKEDFPVTINETVYIPTDNSLTLDKPANAKTVGEKLSDLKTGGIYMPYRRPVIAFSFDGDYNKNAAFKQLFDRHNIKCGYAIPYTTEFLNNAKETYLNWEKEGFEIMGHSAVAVGSQSTATDEEIIQIVKDTHSTLTNYGFDIHGFVAYQGNTKDVALQEAQKIYDYASTKTNHTGSMGGDLAKANIYFSQVAPYELWRYSMQTSTLEQMKAAVDECHTTNGMILFYGHAVASGLGNMTIENIDELLTYIENKGIKIVTPYAAIRNYYSIRYQDIIS